jgi:hypothetical protein
VVRSGDLDGDAMGDGGSGEGPVGNGPVAVPRGEVDEVQVGQFGDRHAAAFRERMGGRHDEVEHRGGEGGHRDARRARSGTRNEGGVETPFEEGFDQPLGAGGGGAGLQEHAGMTPVEFFPRRQPVRR